MNRQFAVFILSHGRANNIKTLKVLKECNYTGKTYIVIDDEDDQADEYFNRYGDNVIQFKKQPVVDRTDTMDLLNEHCAEIYARNEVFNIAKKIGITHFLMMDDDVEKLVYRYLDDGLLRGMKIKNFDKLVPVVLDFLDESDAYLVGFFTAGDYIGGSNISHLHRKCYHAYFCKTEKPLSFYGTIYEDFNLNALEPTRGKLFFSFYQCGIYSLPNKSISGGMLDTYSKTNCYVNMFYPVLCSPSNVKIRFLKGGTYLKSIINSKNCYPMILNEKIKKR